jgi:radical SAM superfamily enzyme YgiQ (UPF0313 family)
MNEWCDMLETLPFKVTYGGYVRLDLFERYPKTAKRLYNNGLRGCSFGIETFHPVAAKIIGKSFSAKKGKQFLDYIWEEVFEKNVFIISTNIIGLPGESFESVEASHKWYKERPHILELWAPLYMSSDPKRWVAPTVFGEDPGKWGYTFPNDSEILWKNEHMDFEQATKKVQEFYTDTNPHSIECWSQHGYFSINNMEPRDYFKLSRTEQIELVKKLQVDVDRINRGYFDALRKYGDSQ